MEKEQMDNIENDVLTIEDGVLTKCKEGLVNLVIPDGVTEIGYGVFTRCKSLASVEFGEGLTEIGNQAFLGCKSLTEIKYNGTMQQWEAVEKGKDLNYGISATIVKCTDGEVKLEQ